ncbi:hypothetical protein ACQKGC_08250 [Allorhizobium pseudoryzae]|uniref:hypothetical protein n=1 Tax=Allorhizobium pseudoryzae TaxID=379684 RepID=UPI003CFFB410
MLARASWIPDISVAASGKRAVLVGNPKWRKDGIFSGAWVTSLYEPPKVKYRPLVNKDQRKALIELVCRYLDQWQASPWQHEGPARRQLRNHFIRLGHSWALSDLEAAKITETAFHRLGHGKRPSWEEGQPEATRKDGNCLQCGKELRVLPGRAATAFFCGDKCQDRYNLHREVTFKASATADAQRLYKAAFLKTLPPVDCGHCGTSFAPKNMGQKYCCHECATAAKTEIPERACACCGTMFRPVDRQKPGKYCSTDCSAKGRTTSSLIPCEECGTPFKVHKSKPKRFCGVICYRANEAKAKATRAFSCDPA